MKKYISPILDIVLVENQDLMTLSGEKWEGDNETIITDGGNASEHPEIDPDGAKGNHGGFFFDDSNWSDEEY